MRVIEEIMVSKFFAEHCIGTSSEWKRDNTKVYITAAGDRCIELHGSRIIYYDNMKHCIYLSCCGWWTRTTLSRLNAFLSALYDKGIVSDLYGFGTIKKGKHCFFSHSGQNMSANDEDVWTLANINDIRGPNAEVWLEWEEMNKENKRVEEYKAAYMLGFNDVLGV